MAGKQEIGQGQQAKEPPELKEAQVEKGNKSQKEPQRRRESEGAKEAQEPKEIQESKKVQEPKEFSEANESQGRKDFRESIELSEESGYQERKDFRDFIEFSEENGYQERRDFQEVIELSEDDEYQEREDFQESIEFSEENEYQGFEEFSDEDEIPEYKENLGQGVSPWNKSIPWKKGIPREMKNPKKKSGAVNRREIFLTGGFFAVLFMVMVGYLGYFTATSEQEMINNSYNSRQEILLSRNYRGAILDRNGEILAETVMDDEQNETRVYPYANLFSHIVGYSINGRMGVEALANYYLINTNTSLSNKAANDVAGVKNPGDTVYTTLDVQLQQVADSQLDIYKGAIVVTEVSTGKLLALVSHPNFDPNQIADIWDSLIEDKNSSVLLNRATQGLYPPGSTFKIITALEYIRQNPDTYKDYSFQCTGYYNSDSNRIRCYQGTNHGVVNFERSFARSCNSSFANIGMGLDQEKFAETLKGLLFGEPLPLTLTYNRSNMAVSGEMSVADMMQTSIGQGKTQITPIHLNMITCAIANGGILMKPYVVDHVENNEGNIVKSFKPGSYGSLLSEEESAILKELMTAVVENGTATNLSGREYSAAGKTGSAEYKDNGDSHAWFTGFAPVDNPEVCVTIIVEGAGNGGDYAVPIARRIFDAYFNQQK